jgi:secreted Zn-dependent insulinase-like peptidase
MTAARFVSQMNIRVDDPSVVSAAYFEKHDRICQMRFDVQSEKSVLTMKEYIDDFISAWADLISDCTDDDFEYYRKSVLSNLFIKSKTLKGAFENHM